MFHRWRYLWDIFHQEGKGPCFRNYMSFCCRSFRIQFNIFLLWFLIMFVYLYTNLTRFAVNWVKRREAREAPSKITVTKQKEKKKKKERGEGKEETRSKQLTVCTLSFIKATLDTHPSPKTGILELIRFSRKSIIGKYRKFSGNLLVCIR